MKGPFAVLAAFSRALALSLLALLPASSVWAVHPFTLTFQGTYGSPVAPSSFASLVQHGFGFNAMLEYNPMDLLSVGAGFEKLTFDGATSSLDTANLELKLYPFGNEKKAYSPYLTAGGGLDLSSVGGAAPYHLMVGLGTKVSLVSVVTLDLGVQSHWFTDPGAFQYVGARAGLNYSFDLLGLGGDGSTSSPSSSSSQPAPQRSSPKSKMDVSSDDSMDNGVSPMTASKAGPGGTSSTKSAPMDLKTDMVPLRAEPTPEAEEEVDTEEAETTTEESPAAESSEVEDTEMMKLYRSGTAAYLRQEYRTALKDLKKCVAIEDDSVKPLYYSEANALIGVSYHVQKNDASAKYYLRKALRLNPKNHAALKYLRKLGESSGEE